MRRHKPPRCRFRALATDGDGTLIRQKQMARATVAALERLRAYGITLILATGENPKELTDFPHLDLFDLIVAENGALLYQPGSRAETLLAEPTPAAFVRALRKRGVKPLKVGRVIVSTERPHDRDFDAVIRELGLDWRVVYNRRQVMALPAGVDKASGLAVALEELGLSATEVVGVGDAANDVALLRYCGCGVAVGNAVPLLKGHADVVTKGGVGKGIVELVERLLAGELPAASRRKKAIAG